MERSEVIRVCRSPSLCAAEGFVIWREPRLTNVTRDELGHLEHIYLALPVENGF
jgi:hypothetical protein